ncbi:hypothetical protein P8452_37560 [Trifolium repens]|nr:hypothetical protein P8452_37560 [Trifolium repens]
MASSSAVGTLAIGALGAPPTIAVAPRQKTLQKNAIGNRTNIPVYGKTIPKGNGPSKGGYSKKKLMMSKKVQLCLI